MKNACIIFLLCTLVLPVFSDSFTLDDWVTLYEEGIIEDEDEYDAAEEFDEDDIEDITEEEKIINIDEETITGEEDTELAEFPEEKSAEEFDNYIIPEEEIAAAEEEDFFDDDLFFVEGPPLIFEAPVFETRSFDDLFPSLSRIQRNIALGENGLRYFIGKNSNTSPRLIPNPDSGIDILSSIMNINPSHVIEALIVVPYNDKEFDLLDIYNALGRIEKIKDYPVLYNGRDYYIFTESSRIVSNRNRRAAPDPPPAVNLPFSETMYICLNEVTLGNIYLRGDVSISAYGITYNMTNFLDVRYFLVPVMRAGRFSTILYLEPVKEGVVIYCMSGFYLPDIVANRVNINTSVNRRIDVFLKWITDGLRQCEQPAGP